ncbi:hypothetical protein D3C72_2147230 [compost metagenome]
MPWLTSTEYSRLGTRREIKVSGASGAEAGTKYTSLVTLSPVAMKIVEWSCDLPTATVKPRSSFSSYKSTSVAGAWPRRCKKTLSLRQFSFTTV